MDVGIAVIDRHRKRLLSTIWDHAATSRPRRRTPGPTCRKCWRLRDARTRSSRSAAPVRCRTNRFRADIWDLPARMGFERCLWGTDWTRDLPS